MKFFVLLVFSLILFIPPQVYSTEKTMLKLHDFSDTRFNGGQPIVFVGKLETWDGKPIPNAKILIKSNDTPCPNDGIIATGLTDKKGRFWIYTLTKIWDEVDNLIIVHAEFEGDENYSSSVSRNQVVVVYPSHAEKCVSI
jgi:hypothetical protein